VVLCDEDLLSGVDLTVEPEEGAGFTEDAVLTCTGVPFSLCTGCCVSLLVEASVDIGLWTVELDAGRCGAPEVFGG
jgi:hypothetical protein